MEDDKSIGRPWVRRWYRTDLHNNSPNEEENSDVQYSRRIGLKINKKETKVPKINVKDKEPDSKIKFNGGDDIRLEANNFVYLDATLSDTGGANWSNRHREAVWESKVNVRKVKKDLELKEEQYEN